jgi:hypothetical protein
VLSCRVNVALNSRPALRSLGVERSTLTRFLQLSPVFSHSCVLFCASKKFNSFIFNRFRTLCAKHPGVGYPLRILCFGFRAMFATGFVPPLFSYRYELLFSQLLSFDIHTNWWGVGASSSLLAARCSLPFLLSSFPPFLLSSFPPFLLSSLPRYLVSASDRRTIGGYNGLPIQKGAPAHAIS